MRKSDLAALFFFLALALIFFAPALFGGATLLPLDNLYRFPPWSSFAPMIGVGQAHNPLLDDLVLENYPWKKFIVDSLRQGEIPLWNPYILTGQPFLAAGQNAALYPLGIVFYLLPLTRAYGVFAAMHFWIAAAGLYVLARVLGLRPLAAAVGGVVFAFSGFMIVSVVFPMVVSAAAWLPAILAGLELSLREEEKRVKGDPSHSSSRELFWGLVTAGLLGLQFLAGHIEASYYILLVFAFYALVRAVSIARGKGLPRSALRLARRGAVLAGIALLGLLLGAIQLVPLAELVQRNFRAGSVSYDQVAGWALPVRQIVTFFIPDFFGNPAHHTYLDVFDWTWKAAPTGTIFWGVKNYVEAGSYVGLLPLLLALIAAASAVLVYVRRDQDYLQLRPILARSQTFLFLALAVLSLLFAFGTPLYAILFYGLPGYNQLHTAFRWIFPYTLCIAILAAVGVEVISQSIDRRLKPSWWALTWLSFVLGASILALLALSLVWQAPFVKLGDWVLEHSNFAHPVFESGRAFWSYESRNILLFGSFLIAAGATLMAARSQFRLPRRLGGFPLWEPMVLVVVVVDLFIFGYTFNSSSDARLLDFTPPAIQFLQNDHSLFRITSYDPPDQKVLNANAGMYFGLQDIRGYDSIIPRQYAEFMGVLAPQEELLQNRIAAFYKYEPLGSPLLNLLNVKYVLTTRAVPNPGYNLVYDREIKIYENTRVLPRAFLVSHARVISDPGRQLSALGSFDPAQEILLETNAPIPENISETPLPVPIVEKYTGSEVNIKTQAPRAAYLVLADAFFPGWIAQIDGQDTPIYRADYNFRAIVVPAGEHTVRFKYSPLSFKVGGVATLAGALILLLGLVVLGWRRMAFAQGQGEGAQARTVAKNSLVPMSASFLIKILSFAFALVMLRVLGPENAGRYAFAVTVWFFFNSITDFGLGILMTREVSRDRSLANSYLTNSAALRMTLTLASTVPLALLIWAYSSFSQLTPDTIGAIVLLWLSLIPANLTASLSYLFNAHERFEYPTIVQVATQILSVALQLAALLAGYGIVGLAAVSIVSNVFTLGVMYYLVRRILFVPHWEFSFRLARWMFFESYPLMLNNLLANLFFRIDVFLLKPLTNDAVVGYYTTAYKWVDAVNFIPSNFTLAIFPVLSRYATSAKEAMYRALLVSLKLLLWIAVPITVTSFLLARELIEFEGGAAYLPDSQYALQWLIWFLPFSFVNSVVHYVLIALNQQRFLTKAFMVGLVFNVIANLLAIPLLSYRGAALVTVLSEVALLVPFYYSLRQHLGSVPVVELLWRPVLAGGAMGVLLYLTLPRISLFVAVPAAVLLYGILLLALGAVGPEERMILERLVPRRFERARSLFAGNKKGRAAT